MIHVMIMAGGKGTRFWPLSRQAKPKQFLSILDDQSLLETTMNRVSGISDNQRTWVLGSQSHRDMFDSLDLSVDPQYLLLEPFGKNTAACIAWGACEALKEDSDAICVVLSADAWINSSEGFCQTIQQAVDVVKQDDALVTIGIPPTRPHPGYGYIAVDTKKGNTNNTGYSVTAFKEKPSIDQAQSYIDQGYYWNAGMFVWRASRIMDCIKRHLPTHYDVIHSFTGKGIRAAADVSDYYSQLESISIDYGVLEHEVDNMVLIPAQFQWDDIGSWSSLAPHFSQDSNQNASKHDLMAHHSHRNIVMSPKGKKVVLAHVDDLIIVDTDDALLILPKEHDQAIKDIYDKLESEFQ
tara:strand:- start:6336 stop:7391 length:1056 start_codon:yes stop_codon:yes gene_type:complete